MTPVCGIFSHVSAQNFQSDNSDCAKEFAFRKSPGESTGGDRGDVGVNGRESQETGKTRLHLSGRSKYGQDSHCLVSSLSCTVLRCTVVCTDIHWALDPTLLYYNILSALHCTALKCYAISAVHFSSVHCSAVQCSALNAVQCSLR